MIYMMYRHNWQDMPREEKEALRDFFEKTHQGTWNWRNFKQNDDGTVTMEAEFIDANAAMLFKLRFGGE